MALLPGTVAPKDGPQDYEGPGLAPEDENGERAALRELPDDVQALLQSLAKKVSAREQWSRIREIYDASEQRFFYKGEQHGFRNRDAGIYQVGQMGGGYTTYGQGSVQPTFRKPFNIYLGYAKSFMAVFCQSDSPVRFEAEDPADSDGLQGAREANKMKRVVDKFNPPKMLQKKLAKFLWTDPRCIAYTRFVVDGQRFGFEDEPFPDEAAEGVESPQPEKVPKGREVISLYGALESKVPLVATGVEEWDFCKLSLDKPLSQWKATYPEKADHMTGVIAGQTGPDQMARLARIGTREGARQISEDSIAHLGTGDLYWFRPSLYWEFQQDDREKLLELFPDGVHCVFVGNTYCESRNESMDDHLSVMHGIEDEGEGRISLGAPEIPIQKSFNDSMNMAEEGFKYAIPFTWTDPEAVDIDAIEEQNAGYGEHMPVKKGSRQAGEALANMFYTEPVAEFPAIFMQWMENLQGPLSQFLTGQQPSLFGGEMSDQKTARGYAMARDQALGLMSLVWNPYTIFRARTMLQAVRIGANERTKRGQQNLSVFVGVPGKPNEQEPLDVALEDLKANLLCYPESDANFPESWAQKRNTFMQVMQFAGQDPVVQQMVTDPNNLTLVKDLIGLTDATIPGEEDRNKQLLEIAEMRKSPPVPDIQAIDQEIMQGAATGQMPPLDQSTMPMTSSVPIGDFDNDAVELAVCINWINGHEGQQAKRSQNPQDQEWYKNVELHAKAHQTRIQQQQAQQAMQMMAVKAATAPPPKAAPGENAEGSARKPQATPPEGQLPQPSGPPENPSPLM